MLEVANLEVVYHDVILAVRGISFTVPPGRIVALLGANGAGKTTVLRAISGLLDLQHGDITKGEIRLDGEPIHRRRAEAIVRGGITQVMEGRRIFPEFTDEENLRVGAHVNVKGLKSNLDRVYGLLPVMAQLQKMRSGFMSVGEKQMMAMGMALMYCHR